MSSPADTLYTRQQVENLTGVPDAMLAYWLKQGLLVPNAGGEGRGSHRRFDFVQVNIAAIYGQVRRFGLNIEALRSLGDLLQSAAKLGAQYKLHPSNYSTAARLATKLNCFRNGEAILLPKHGRGEEPPKGLRGSAYAEWLMENRPAESEGEVVQHIIQHWIDYDSAETILAAANDMGPDREVAANVYSDLVTEVFAPGYSSDYSWLVSLDPGQACRIEFGFDGAKFFEMAGAGSAEEFGSAIFIPVSGIFRRIWGFKTAAERRLENEEWRREDDRKSIEDLLVAAGIPATVSIHDDPEKGFNIAPPDTDMKAVRAALKGSKFEFGNEEQAAS